MRKIKVERMERPRLILKRAATVETRLKCLKERNAGFGLIRSVVKTELKRSSEKVLKKSDFPEVERINLPKMLTIR
jgi:hypothetical protein